MDTLNHPPRAGCPVPDRTATASAADFQRDLSRYWRHVRKKGELGLTTRGWLYKAAFRAVLAALAAPPEAPDSEERSPRLAFMRQLLAALRELVESQARVTAHPEGRFFQQPLAERVRRSFDTWRDVLAWPESPDSADFGHYGMAAWIKARSAILRALARAEKTATIDRLLHAGPSYPDEGSWSSVAHLVDSLTAPAPDRNPEHTGLLNRPMILSTLAGPLHWLGLVDLGYAAPAEEAPATEGLLPVAYRLTDTGRWLLDVAAEPVFVEHGGRVVVQPNFAILAMEPISDTVLMDLDVFADAQGGDRVTTFHLTRQSVYRGQRAGWDVARIISFLEQHQGGALPANVRRSLEEWHQLHHRIVIHRNACVVQSADDAARDGVRQALAPLHVRLSPLGSHYDLVEPGRHIPAGAELPARIAGALADAGWMPQISPADARDVQGCLRLVPAEGAAGHFLVVFKPAVPSLYALGQLAPFTQPAGESSPDLLLTPDSIRAALTGGASLDEILAALGRLHDGPLPPAVEDSLRTWARFYGHARTSPVYLIEFSDAEVLNNLLDDAAAAACLSPVEGSLKPLAVVDARNIDAARELIRERGIELD